MHLEPGDNDTDTEPFVTLDPEPEQDALRRDAERYRWLRSINRLGYWRIQKWEVEAGEWSPDAGRAEFETLNESELDEAIDEARAADLNSGSTL